MQKEHKSTPSHRSPRERIADAFGLSRDVILDTVTVKVLGCREMTIQNYKGILEYSDTCIRIKAKPKAVKICGRDLELKTITDEVLYITGAISSFAFIDR